MPELKIIFTDEGDANGATEALDQAGYTAKRGLPYVPPEADPEESFPTVEVKYDGNTPQYDGIKNITSSYGAQQIIR